MASKTTKRARQAAEKHLPVEKDDGTRWIVVRDGYPVYISNGSTKAEAVRLAKGLREPATIQQL